MNTQQRLSILTGLLAINLAACSGQSGAGGVSPVSTSTATPRTQPTTVPVSTSTAKVPPVVATKVPTQVPANTPPPQPTVTATTAATPTSGPISGNTELMTIAAPSLLDKITSPVHVAGLAGPLPENEFLVRILDVDGKELGHGTATIQADRGQRGPYQADISFTAPAQPGAGRVEISASSPRDGGLVHVNSVEVSLNPNAPTPPALTPPPAAAVNQEDIVITAPEAGNMITSTVHVAGESEPTFEQTLLVRVFDQDGATLAEKSTIIAADAGQRGKFALDLPIELPAAPEAGRVVVLTTSPRDGGITHLASVEVKLSGKATP